MSKFHSPVTAESLPTERGRTNLAAARWAARWFVIFGIVLVAESALAQSVAHYALDETVAGPVVESVNGFNGTNNGATINQPGQFGTAYDFDGSNDSVNVGNQPAFDFDYDTPFTASAWVLRQGTSTRGIVGNVNPNSPFDGWSLAQRDFGGNSAVSFSLGASDPNRLLVESNVGIPSGTLTHLTVTYDGSGLASGIRQYLNGLPVSTNATRDNATGTAINSRPLSIGSYGGANRFFDGTIDDVGIFNQALTFAQVQSVYQNGIEAFNAGATVTGDRRVISYDGTYAPISATPPPGQTAFSVFDNIATVGGDITPNSPSAGLANINDNSTGGRLSFFKTLTDSTLNELAWTTETRLRVNDLSLPGGTFVSIGVRDEGAAGGKNAMLGFNPDGSLFLGDASISVSSDSFNDDLFHTYRVEKFEDNGDFLLQVFVDDVAQFGTPLAYDDLPSQVSATNGFGFFTPTPGTANVDVDFLTLDVVVSAVPEPASLALWGMIGCATLFWFVRRRKM